MRALQHIAAAILLLGGVAVGFWWLVSDPESPLPRQWNPTKRLYIEDPLTPLTGFKLDAASGDYALCQEVLAAGGIPFGALPPLRESEQCFVDDHVNLRGLGRADLADVATSCAVAVRMAMWERHGLQLAAKTHLGSRITQVEHFSSYNCRAIRTSAGAGRRMSTHATAEAIDISGFRLEDGRRLSLLRDWDREPEFFSAIRDSACTWFETVLGPDYNRLHADHFHLQSRGWGTCR